MELPLVIGNRFELGRKLGAGNFGTVYQAQDKQTGSFVAVKKVLKGADENAALELALLQYVTQRGVPNVLQWLGGPYVREVDEKTYEYTVLSLIPGEDLLDYLLQLATARLSPPQQLRQTSMLLNMMQSLMKTYQDLNAICVMHNDIKPSNVRLDLSRPDAPVPVVIDFGLGCFKPECAQGQPAAFTCPMDDTWMGTPGYIPPEGFSKKNKNFWGKNRQDVFSAGVLLHDMATGHLIERRFPDLESKGYDDYELLLAELQPTGDDRLDALISSMVAKQVSKRPSWEQVLSVLQQIQSQPVPFTIVSMIRSSKRPVVPPVLKEPEKMKQALKRVRRKLE